MIHKLAWTFKVQLTNPCVDVWSCVSRKLADVSLMAVFLVCLLGIRTIAAPAVPDEMIEQLKRLPQSEQQALAGQYGIELNAEDDVQKGTAMTPDTDVGTRGELIQPVKTVILTEALPTIESSGVPRFGMHLFDKEVSTFAPVDNIPVPEGYLLGVGDTLNVMLHGKEQMEQVLQIDREGAVNFPRLGVISLAGLSFPEAKQMIENRVAKQLIGTDVIVSMGRLRSISIFMAGEVRTPGSYSVSALSTVTQALYVAGGITNIGSLRRIQVLRGGVEINTFDVYGLMLEGDVSGDIRLQSGDVVFVPIVGSMVTIEGAVRRPGQYELLGEQTLSGAIEMAGGLLGRGAARGISMERYSRGKELPEKVDVRNAEESSLMILLQDGDRISVPRVPNRLSNPVELLGAFNRPGVYAWREGSRFSDYVTSIDADLLPSTDLGAGLIVRRRNAALEIDVLAFEIVAALNNKYGDEDPVIHVHDQIILFGLPESQENQQPDLIEPMENQRSDLIEPVLQKLRSQANLDEDAQIVSIDGAVRVPGEYPRLHQGSLKSLIALAGGLEDGAYTVGAEIRRVTSVPGTSAKVELIELPLESVINGEGDASLESRDAIFVKSVPGWNPTDVVILTGEVTYPGSYLISAGETLSSVLKRAGGVTRDGFPEGSVFTRISVLESEQTQLKNLANAILRTNASRALTTEGGSSVPVGFASSADVGEQESLTQGILGIESIGRMVVDVPSVVSGDVSADIVLQDGDVLAVPPRSNSVNVVGEVNQPGAFRYGENIKYLNYIDLAAGYTSRANKRDTYIVKANGSVVVPGSKVNRFFSRVGEIDIEEGDTLVVPINQQYKPTLSRYREVTTVIFQTVTSIAALFSLGN